MQQLLKTYLKRLTNLSGTNKSLVLLRLTEQFIDLHDLDFAQMRPSFDIIKDLMARKKEINICDLVNSRDEDSNKLSRRLKRLNRIEKFIYEESGTRDLYVGWPFIRGRFNDGGMVSGPLLFFPVEIALKNNQWVLRQREEVNVTLNKSFLLAYGFFNDVKIEDDLLERVFDDFDTDSTVFRTALYQLLKESPIEINFNRENFEDKLQQFPAMKKDEFLNETREGEIKLFPFAVLGIFPQAGSQLVPDYIHMMEEDEFKELDSFFESRSNVSEKKIREEEIFAPFDLDAFQEEALIKVKQGNSIVVQGPPGTGKSQLICNIVSDCIANKKNVLVVSQKRAALDVVFKRLSDIELGEFIGLVHDYKNDRKLLYEKLSRQIEKSKEYENTNNGLDFIYLERQFNQSSRSIDKISEDLEEYKFALFDESECGISVKELYLTSDLSKPSIDIRQEYKFFNFHEQESFLNRLKIYVQYHNKFDADSSPVRARKSFKGHTITDLKKMKDILKNIPVFQNEILVNLDALLGKKMDLEEADYFLSKKEEVEVALGIISDPKVYKYFSHIVKYPDRQTDALWLSNQERVLMDCFKGSGIERSIYKTDLGKIQELIEKAINARKNPWSYLKWTLFSKEKFHLKRIIVANGLTNDKKGFSELIKKIDNRLNLEHNLTALRDKDWIVEVPSTYEKIGFQNWFHLQREALKSKLMLSEIRNFGEFVKISGVEYEQIVEVCEQLFEIVENVPVEKASWSVYFSNTEIQRFLYDHLTIHEYDQFLDRSFDEICDFDGFKEDLSVPEVKVVDKVISELTMPINVDEAIQLFDNSLRLFWVDHIETKYPILRISGTIKMYNWISEIQQSVQLKSESSRQILLMKSREKVYENIEYNRLNNPVTYREIQHQVNKKRRIWPLRKLLSEYHEQIFQLIPCWMASPESVSAIFPMHQIFDVVIFDEASQCFSERGIPAMYRASKVVIAGDSQQLQPNDLYQIRWEDEDEDDIGVDASSLLDLSKNYLENIPLRGHYRSKTPDLIDFSNIHFYKKELNVLPDRNVVIKGTPGIKYINVKGTWDKNSNLAEAQEVVRIIKEQNKTSPGKSIGVVTFNIHQQNQILDELEYAQTENSEFLIPEDLFVKNIDNVQGDERDIIIFSVAYGFNTDKKLILKFGSLNVAGGENRLNVAVTRAREKIFLVTSIEPEDLKTEDLKNDGPKLLKSYLQYCKQVSDGNYKPIQISPLHSSQSWYLKEKILNIDQQLNDGSDVQELFPFADLTVLYKEKLAGLIFTDDDQYYKSKSVKDSFVYNHNHLVSKNWTYKQVYSRKYWMDKNELNEELIKYIVQSMPDEV